MSVLAIRKAAHKMPRTDEERIADGQKKFEFYDSDGNMIFYCYRHKMWQANRAMKYHFGRIERQRARQRETNENMSRIISDWCKQMEAKERSRQIKAGLTDINKVTFFDLLEADSLEKQ